LIQLLLSPLAMPIAIAIAIAHFHLDRHSIPLSTPPIAAFPTELTHCLNRFALPTPVASILAVSVRYALKNNSSIHGSR
jgi:hypothetical protein